MRYLLRMFGVVLFSSGLASSALAQEVEPNNNCFAAQPTGTLTTPFAIQGSLDGASAAPNTTTDVDFFTFSGTPGQRLSGAVGSNHLLALFDAQCARLDSTSFGDRLLFDVPASGSFTLGVADRFDNSLSGNGITNPGPYALTLGLQAPSIGSISGRLVDALTIEPLLPRQSTRVELQRCSDGFCSFVDSQSTDALGRFRFEFNSPRRRMPVGTYVVVGSATEYGSRSSERVAVGADEDVDFGDIALTPPPVLFSGIAPCASLLPQGGVCEFSANIRNNTRAPLAGVVRSIVRGSNFFSSGNPVLFEANSSMPGDDARRILVEVPPFSSSVVTFAFEAPSFLSNGNEICADLYLGVRPSPLFNTVRTQNLFCLRKGANGFELMNADETQALLEREARSASMLQPQN